MAPVTPEEQVLEAGRGGSLINPPWERAEPRPCLAKRLALNREIKQPAVPVCPGISDRQEACSAERTVATQPGSRATELGHTRKSKELAQKDWGWMAILGGARGRIGSCSQRA